MGSDQRVNKDRYSLSREEFVQLHEHIRQSDTVMVQILTVVIVASTTLLSAISAFYFEHYINTDRSINVAISYLFLAPLLIVIPGLAMIRASRRGIYRMGTFIKVFYENSDSGAMWHRCLDHFRRVNKDETMDYVPYAFWMITLLCIGLFWFALSLANTKFTWHWLVALPFLIILGWEHANFRNAKKSELFERSWQEVYTEINDTLNSEPLPKDI